MARQKHIILVISIDTECDKGRNWGIKYPLSFRGVEQGIQERLHPFFLRNNVKVTYLLSPEVIQDSGSVNILRNLEFCELGAHLHSEFIVPDKKAAPHRTSTPQAALTCDNESKKLRKLTELFEEKIGRKPTSFRAGRFGLSKNSLQFLDKLGYSVDSSVTPFRRHNFSGDLTTDFWGAPITPYHPSSKDYRAPGKLKLLEVPVSCFIPSLVNFPPWLLRLTSNKRYWYKRLSKNKMDHHSLKFIRPLKLSAEGLIHWSDFLISNFPSSKPPIINIMFHNVEVIPGANPYTFNEEDVKLFFISLQGLITHFQKNYYLTSLNLSELINDY